jgi:UDP-N-acetylglucosamine--N-acetylmuramyl-(pentapeptide) pyrophosphoryl-undecaprenol N-acetylglucosamine transferase
MSPIFLRISLLCCLLSTTLPSSVESPVCFVAGKSGGHLVPCITQAKKIYEQNPQAQLYVFTSGSELDQTILKKHNFIKELVPTTLANPPYNQPWLMPWFAVKTFWYFLRCLQQLHRIQPSKLVTFGGFICIPACFAAKILDIPIQLYELNVQPGKATQFLSKFSDTVYTCFQATNQYFPDKECIHFDYPVRFTPQDRIFNRSVLLQTYHFVPNRKILLILGGSQGSILLNQVVKEMIEQHPELATTLQVIHQTGQSDPFDYANFYKNYAIPAVVFKFHDKLQDFYNLADLILTRAGAGSLFEIKFFEKTCITVPHQTEHTNHQIENVLEMAHEFPDQFYIIKQTDFTPSSLYHRMQRIFCKKI